MHRSPGAPPPFPMPVAAASPPSRATRAAPRWPTWRLQPRAAHLAARLVAGLGLAAVAACQDALTAPSRTPAPRPAAAAAAVEPDSLALPTLARGLGLALADTALRQQVLEDLRDSPFAEHTIHAASYLAGPRGRQLLEAAAARSGLPVATLLSSVARTPDLAFVVPVKLDRIRWEGASDVVVVATARTKADIIARGSVDGVTTKGERVVINPSQVSPFPVVALLRADAPFGSDPEAVRGRAPHRTRSTVSTREETYHVAGPAGAVTTQGVESCPPNELSCICYYTPSDPRCAPSPAPTGPGVKLPSQFDDYSCRSTAVYSDYDNDGLNEKCEAELAYAFRPQLSISASDDYPFREPYWAVYPTTQPGVAEPYQLQIFYAVSWYRDAGSPVDPVHGYTAHQGDSEFIVIRVKYYSYQFWTVNSAFLSAHYGDWGDSSAEVDWQLLEWAQYTRGRARIYTAEDKHGSYYSRSQCDKGAYYADNCDRNLDSLGRARYEVEALPTANLGNTPLVRNGVYFRGNPTPTLDCVASRKFASGGRRECYWTGTAFRGWQDDHDGYLDGTSASAYNQVIYTWLYR